MFCFSVPLISVVLFFFFLFLMKHSGKKWLLYMTKITLSKVTVRKMCKYQMENVAHTILSYKS